MCAPSFKTSCKDEVDALPSPELSIQWNACMSRVSTASHSPAADTCLRITRLSDTSTSTFSAQARCHASQQAPRLNAFTRTIRHWYSRLPLPAAQSPLHFTEPRHGLLATTTARLLSCSPALPACLQAPSLITLSYVRDSPLPARETHHDLLISALPRDVHESDPERRRRRHIVVGLMAHWKCRCCGYHR
jgi:hypothetical protein